MKPDARRIPKVAIYCRLSEEDRFKVNSDDDSNSIANQKALLLQYCMEHNWNVFEIYSDDDFTGSDRNRPAFNRMLNDAEQRRFDIIMCKTLSRFTREVELVEKYIHTLFPQWGIRFISVVDNADTAVEGNKKARQINALINEWYLEDMSENIKAVLTNRRKQGFFIGAFAPYGYKKDPDLKGHLIIDEEAAAVVRKIFDLYLAGFGRAAIARELNRQHIPTPTDYKIQHGDRYKCSHAASHTHLWRYFNIAGILTNEVYIGNLIQNRAHSISYKSKKVKPTDSSEWIRVNNTHEPIIDNPTWDLAQAILNGKPKPTFETCEPNIFSRKVICAECGRIMKQGKKSAAKGGNRYLRCSTKYYAPDECIGARISYDSLETCVLTEFQEIAKARLDIDKVSSELVLTDKIKEAIERCQTELIGLNNELKRQQAYIKNLYVDKIKEVINEETYKQLSQEFLEEKQKTQIRIHEIEQELKVLAEKKADTVSKREIVEQYANCTELTAEIVQIFIDKIVVHHTKPYSRQVNIEIFWKI